MLTDYWLLADLDGTLVATPHKANGLYLPITQSPCFEPLKQWLSSGGNLCIITTADLRAFNQVYHPLKAFLKTYQEYVNEAAAAGTPLKTVDGTVAQPPRRGCLLLSLYTGAVLYWCTSDSIIMLPEYTSAVHCATRESVELADTYHVRMSHATLLVDGSDNQLRAQPEMYVHGTCIDVETTRLLQTQIESLYLDYVRDVLSGTDLVVRKAVKWLSRRYQCMWGGLLQYLELIYNVVVHQNTTSLLELSMNTEQTLLALEQESPADPVAVEWKMSYLRSRRGFLTAVGILRIEYVESHVWFAEGKKGTLHREPSQNIQTQTRDAERAQLVSYVAQVLLADFPATVASRLAAATATMASFLVDLLGPSVRTLPPQMREAKLPTTEPESPPLFSTSTAPPGDAAIVAQVILLGLPLSLFSKYFRSHVEAMVRGGVNAIPQPNSIVFSKMGVSKSTALRYLLGKDRVASVEKDWQLRSTEVTSSPTTGPASRAANFVGCLQRYHGIAMGDNPQSSDFELTVFRDLPFLSVEKESQRVERQRRILRRLRRTQLIEARGGQPLMPDGSRAPSYAELVSSLRRSGPMMDDRLFGNINYVGGEEEGTALFLAALLHYATAKTKNGQGKMTTVEFRDAVQMAQATSRDQVMLRLPLAKL
ncbi:conserved hypothetical protein [Leishmania braziliensis MHOM/BR/75/M2904]|uniref:Uncharacterized protein n=2 Tax=Leishmania braziliensis TaxID=5660 RepID=A4HLV4_LEIBR|nr:conserved hypothetical protein [Leishmania braziliensis MHOM/BR/75/M2904]CAJ2479626.1 unnamed protein product [Leishmania braziliensis]CAJ2479972.1 unnamed protein product [Leishmania braziliensis]CAM40801.1 conserved hypothetical protein [Leishmania braziliensis MHOM/BR/75/M2904]SYZ69212.1 hypothetical_protein [Leishmania braziliensis MHOM/BR/75/M2904]